MVATLNRQLYAKVERWLQEGYPKIAARAQRKQAQIFFGDETWVRSDCHAGAPGARSPSSRRPGPASG